MKACDQGNPEKCSLSDQVMDSVPDSAVCNEAVKLAQRKGFYSLKPFVNGVLRTIAREWKNLKLPSREENPVRYLSVRYSMPETLVNRWA